MFVFVFGKNGIVRIVEWDFSSSFDAFQEDRFNDALKGKKRRFFTGITVYSPSKRHMKLLESNP